MSIDFYLSELKENQKLILMQGRAPYVLSNSQEQKSVSGEIFSRKEIFDLMSNVGLNSSSLKGLNHFYSEGRKYLVNSLVLPDLIHLEISHADDSLFIFSDLVLPGYVFDWAQSSKGLVVFYSSDVKDVKKFNLSFAKFRADQLAGSSLVFNETETSFVGREDHRIIFSGYQNEYLNSQRNAKSFDHISYSSELRKDNVERVMSDIDQQTLVSSPVHWSDISSTWGFLRETFNDERKTKFLLNNLIGFVGIKSVNTQSGQQEYLFETIPFQYSDLGEFAKMSFTAQANEIEKMKNSKGYSFNQSIQTLLLKRRIILESAYEVSPDPKQLNNMLTQVGF